MGWLKPEVCSPEKEQFSRENDYWLRKAYRREAFVDAVTGVAIGAGVGAVTIALIVGAVWLFV